MRQKDIIKALQNVDEKSAVQLGADYHGIADMDHERLLRRVEQQLEWKKAVQNVQEMPEEPQISAPKFRGSRFPWITVGMTAACCMVGALGVGLIWNMHCIAPKNQTTETVTEATSTQYQIYPPVVTGAATTEKPEEVTTICTTAATVRTTPAVSSYSIQAVPHTSVTTETVFSESSPQTVIQTTIAKTSATVQTNPVIETKQPSTTVSIPESTAAVTTEGELIGTTEPVQTNDQGQIVDPNGNIIVLHTTAATEDPNPKPTIPTETVQPTAPKEVLKMSDVMELAKKGDALTWEDFKGYQGEDIGSGIFIYKYDLGNGYALYVGGLPDSESKPYFIELRKDSDMRNGIDIRTEDIEVYMKENPS